MTDIVDIEEKKKNFIDNLKLSRVTQFVARCILGPSVMS